MLGDPAPNALIVEVVPVREEQVEEVVALIGHEIEVLEVGHVPERAGLGAFGGVPDQAVASVEFVRERGHPIADPWVADVVSAERSAERRHEPRVRPFHLRLELQRAERHEPDLAMVECTTEPLIEADVVTDVRLGVGVDGDDDSFRVSTGTVESAEIDRRLVGGNRIGERRPREHLEMAADGGVQDRRVGQVDLRLDVDLGHLVGVGLLPTLSLEVLRREVVDVVVVLLDHGAMASGIGLLVVVIETGQHDAVEPERCG